MNRWHVKSLRQTILIHCMLTERMEFTRDRERRRESMAKFGLCGTVSGWGDDWITISLNFGTSWPLCTSSCLSLTTSANYSSARRSSSRFFADSFSIICWSSYLESSLVLDHSVKGHVENLRQGLLDLSGIKGISCTASSPWEWNRFCSATHWPSFSSRDDVEERANASLQNPPAPPPPPL